MVSVADSENKKSDLSERERNRAELERLRLNQEILNVKQLRQGKESEKEKVNKNLTSSFSAFSGSWGFAIFLAIVHYWGFFALFAFFGILSTFWIISENKKIKKLDREIERLKKQEKKLRNSIR